MIDLGNATAHKQAPAARGEPQGRLDGTAEGVAGGAVPGGLLMEGLQNRRHVFSSDQKSRKLLHHPRKSVSQP
jgi:hypothetical protein